MFRTATFTSESKSGAYKYKIFDATDFRYIFLIIPFLLTLHFILPAAAFIFLGPAAMNAEFPIENRLIASFFIILAAGAILVPLYFMIDKPSDKLIEFMERLGLMEFSVSPERIEFPGHPDYPEGKSFAWRDVTQLTLRNPETLDYVHIGMKRYVSKHRLHARRKLSFSEISQSGTPLLDIIFPPTFWVDLETQDSIFSISTYLSLNKSKKLINQIIKDARLQITETRADHCVTTYRLHDTAR